MRLLLLVLVLVGYADICSGQQAEIIKLEKLKQILALRSDSIHVINFWATWCAPCVKELPLFEKLNAQHRPGIAITLVSMDLDLDPNPDKVYRFIERKKIRSRVLILDEKDPNSWIDQIDTGWSGALPTTIIINQKTGQRKLIEKELHEGDLERLIEELR